MWMKNLNLLLAMEKKCFRPMFQRRPLERITAIATDLASEGREGKAIGAMFMLGDHKEVTKRSKPLISKSVFGYDEEDRSILNPIHG
jgi:DNA integrity scanning protein DisA with diadenylate cyclase activity